MEPAGKPFSRSLIATIDSLSSGSEDPARSKLAL
ncbi:hypothetical protein SALBM135S_09167 [Streptomyces alboniger]